MASNYISLPPQGGGGGGAVDSVNGLTGVVVLTKSNIGLGNVDNTSDATKNAAVATLSNKTLSSPVINSPTGLVKADVGLSNVDNTSDANKPISSATQTALDDKQDEILGNNNEIVYKNSSGAVESLDTLNVTAQLGLNQDITDDIENADSHSVNFHTLRINPTEASPDTATTFQSVQLVLDPDDTGLDIGSNGTAAQMFNNQITHQGSSDTGSLSFHTNTFSVGNGTDSITVDGISYIFGFGEVQDNVNLNGAVQGYGFQPVIRDGATVDQTNSYTQAFYDNMTYEGDSSYHTSFNAGPTIENIPASKNFTGVSVNPTVNTIDGSITGVAVSGNLGTFGPNTFFNGINVNPTIDNARYAAAIDVTMDNVTAYAGVQATLIEQDLTFTFNTVGAGENSFTLEYTPGATAGSEVVGLSGTDITVQIEDGVSTATQIKAAMEAVPQLASAITITISGVGSNPQDVFGPTNFSGGENAGQVLAARLDGNVEISGSLTFGGALSIGQLNAFAAQAVVAGSGNPASIHNLISNPTVGNNQTIALGDTIGVNTAMLLTVGTNSSVTSALVGLSALALPAVVNLGAGSTVDRVAGATFAISLDMGAAGTIDNLDLCRAVGLPNGTTTVTRLKGYAMDLPFGDPGTTTWGFYESPGVHNYFAGDLLIGGTAGSDDVVTNSSVALEIKSTTKAFLNARMSTSERDALTAVDGMQVYNTTTNKLQIRAAGTWVDLH